MTLAQKLEDEYPDEQFLLADGFDKAFLGVDCESRRVVYSVERCIDILMEEDMSHSEAVEFFDFNVSGAYVGEKTPIWCDSVYF